MDSDDVEKNTKRMRRITQPQQQPQQRKRIILVDMDGVLANMEAACLEEWRRQYPQLPYIPLERRTCYDIRADYARLDPSYGPLMQALICAPDFYTKFPVISGAHTVLDEMLAVGYEVFICTSPVPSPDCVAAKVDWILHVFGQQWVERTIMTRDKTMVQGDVLIDDKPEIQGLVQPPPFVHVLFDQPYNYNTAKPRITNWPQWREVVEHVLR